MHRGVTDCFFSKPWTGESLYLHLLPTHPPRVKHCSLQLCSPAYRCVSFTVSLSVCQSARSCKDSALGTKSHHCWAVKQILLHLSWVAVLSVLCWLRTGGRGASLCGISFSSWNELGCGWEAFLLSNAFHVASAAESGCSGGNADGVGLSSSKSSHPRRLQLASLWH